MWSLRRAWLLWGVVGLACAVGLAGAAGPGCAGAEEYVGYDAGDGPPAPTDGGGGDGATRDGPPDAPGADAAPDGRPPDGAGTDGGGNDIYIAIEKTCTTVTAERVSYTVTGHL